VMKKIAVFAIPPPPLRCALSVILLRIQTTHPRQPVADTNLIPGLIKAIFQLADNGKKIAVFAIPPPPLRCALSVTR
jgi:hypothetical protein